jgi:hypothetical protein
MEDDLDIIFVRYEDLRDKPVETIIEVGGFLGIELEREEAHAVSKSSSLAAMVEMEKRGSLVDPDYPFVRRGDVRRVEEELTTEMREAIAEWSRVAMELFGYRADCE